jgi:hypothetical protein
MTTNKLEQVTSLLREAAEVLEAVGVSGVPLPDNWRWPLADELLGTAALASAPAGEAVYQCMATDEDHVRNGPKNIWMDVDRESFDKLRARDDMRSRILYTHPTPAADASEGPQAHG